VDFNRAGTPLVEIVTEPDLRSEEEAREWAQLLRTTVRQLGVSDVNMEEGSLRVDANVSIRRAGESELGTKTELKNMNSFRFLERGIEAELDRQVGVVESGEEVAQETFHFDPRAGSLTPLRSKEYAHDYRYFPEPDLVPLAPTEEMLSAARDALPELPAKRRERYRDELGLPDESARQLAFDADLGEYFEDALDAADGLEPRIVANWVTGELAAAQRHFGHKKDVEPTHVAEVVRMVADKRISHASGREVLHTLSDPGSSVAGPEEVVERRQLEMESDASALEAIVAAAIEAEPAAAEKVRAGNPKAVGPIVGAVMRETKGTADGGEVTRLIREQLSAG
jgi:aspartyl-tRNA(Asn)/glutamyl-tRNA(Gln) amidotransferase subunit B